MKRLTLSLLAAASLSGCTTVNQKAFVDPATGTKTLETKVTTWGDAKQVITALNAKQTKETQSLNAEGIDQTTQLAPIIQAVIEGAIKAMAATAVNK